MSISKTVSRTVSAMALLLLLVAPLAAAERVVFRGVDLWTTAGDGNTFVDFKLQPIPAGFFCAGSASFGARLPGMRSRATAPDSCGTSTPSSSAWTTRRSTSVESPAPASR